MTELTTHDVLRRLSDRKARAICEVCGQNQWQVIGEGDTAHIVTFPVSTSFTEGMAISGPQLPAFLNACANCGNLRFHAVGVLAPELMKPK